MKIVIFWRKKAQRRYKKPGDFYPVYRKGPLGGQFRAIGAIKYVVFEEAKNLDESADISDRVS